MVTISCSGIKLKNNIKRVAIVQARMGSKRLPNKMLYDLNGQSIIEWVIKRSMRSHLLDDIVVAIPNTEENDVLNRKILETGTKVFRGDESDVLSRFYFAAEEIKATHVVRVCADNPLIDGKEIDNLINYYFDNICDYAYNHIPKNNNYPDGLGAEIVSFQTLRNLHHEAKAQKYREHIFNYIWDRSNQFKIKTFDPPRSKLKQPEIRLDLDTIDDFNWLKKLNVTPQMNSEEIINLALKIPRNGDST